MVNNFKNKNKKIWYAIILVAMLSVLVIGLIVYNKIGGDRNATQVNLEDGSSQSSKAVSSSSSNSSASLSDKPNDVLPPSLTIPR